MSRRIGLWALAGFAVACFWVIFSLIIPRGINFGHWAITSITAPASLLRHRPVTWYEFILLNAAMYGLAGLAVEPFRLLLRLRGRRPTAPGH
ncbi:MAG TPA: hypothetical protein VFD98_08730 [Terracidiphilus sp.]|jgi:hypothetical protein|nr:hypothetical protein [Terracidiphilus sp.]